MFPTSYDALHLTELALYSDRKLGAKPLDIDALILVLPEVGVHQLYSFDHFYKRDENDISNANLVHHKRIEIPSRQHC